VPEPDGPRVLELSHAVVSMYEPSPAAATRRQANDAARELLGDCHDLIRARRARRRTDLVSDLIAARVDGAALSDDQIASTTMVLLMAGHEASVNAASNGVAALAAHADEWLAIRGGAVSIGTAVEEALRWDPPLQYFSRWVLEDGFRVGGPDGVAIPVGERVGLMIGSANRDPRRTRPRTPSGSRAARPRT